MPLRMSVLSLVIGCAAVFAAAIAVRPVVLAQAMIPPTGMGPADKAMAAQDMAAAERMRRRFPQAVRVGDLIGLPLLDDGDRTLGYVRQVVRTPQDKIELIVAYGGCLGWGARARSRCRSKSSALRGGSWRRSICRAANTPPRRRGGERTKPSCQATTRSA